MCNSVVDTSLSQLPCPLIPTSLMQGLITASISQKRKRRSPKGKCHPGVIDKAGSSTAPCTHLALWGLWGRETFRGRGGGSGGHPWGGEVWERTDRKEGVLTQGCSTCRRAGVGWDLSGAGRGGTNLTTAENLSGREQGS